MPGIVNKDIDLAELFAARGDDMGALCVQGQIGWRARRAPALA